MKPSTLFATLALLAATAPVFGADPPPPASTLRPLDETALRATAMRTDRPTPPVLRPAPPRNRLLDRWLFPAGADGGSEGGFLRALSHPLFGLLNADVSARDISYAPGAGVPTVAPDGSYNLTLPLTVGEINLQNIRTGASDSNSFGSIQIRNLDLGRTVITVTPTK